MKTSETRVRFFCEAFLILKNILLKPDPGLIFIFTKKAF
jgi:hypothetical protein